MANPKHIDVVRKGQGAIDAWRRRNVGIRLDLENAELRDLDLQGADLSLAVLRNTKWEGADLRDAVLSDTLAAGARFSRARLDGIDLSSSDLSKAQFNACDVRLADFSQANLSLTSLCYSDFGGSNFGDADLSRATLRSCQFDRADFTRSRFVETLVGDCDLSQVVGIEFVEHSGPSSIGADTVVDTVRGAGGRFTFEQEAFFVAAGVPVTLLENVQRSGSSNAMSLYNALITFGPADTGFGHFLYRELRKRQIICWKSDDDAPRQWGRSTSKPESHSYDKLVVVCSKDSLNQVPVLSEIARALLKERLLKSRGVIDTDVLFLVQRDDYMTNGWDHNLKGAMLSKFSADFTQEEDYQGGVSQLINALRLSAMSAPG